MNNVKKNIQVNKKDKNDKNCSIYEKIIIRLFIFGLKT